MIIAIENGKYLPPLRLAFKLTEVFNGRSRASSSIMKKSLNLKEIKAF